MPRLDPHSYADSDQPQADALDWRAHVDFASRTLTCTATLHLREPAAAGGPMDLDTRGLHIHSVVDAAGRELRFELGGSDPILGTRLRVMVPPDTRSLRLTYRTAEQATALQWLEPQQTADQKHPFVYTQCQPIHTRSIVPLQDTPRTRLRYTAELTYPAGLTALMAAQATGLRAESETATASFRMQQPIAPYLFAFVIGDLASRELSERCRVWAEPSVVDAAAWEFAETEHMLQTSEQLFGPYDWDRYDVLVLPPSFPYGGMENPRLTFVTSAVLAGDRSLLAVIPHELAHSWTGNLISNANAEHFWLNEGWTTYAERRIVEALWGTDVAALDWALGRREADEAIARFERQSRPELTQLRTHLAGVDPDDAFSVVPYEKGALFLRALEEAVGRERFDAFIRAYIAELRFKALTTEDFLEFAAEQLGAAALQRIDADAWLHSPGVPPDAPAPRSARLEAIERLDGRLPGADLTERWTATEWQLYLDSLTAIADLAELDSRYQLSSSRNADVLVKWLTLGARRGYEPAYAKVEEVLCRYGRIKYLRPLYEALAARAESRPLAERIFAQCAPTYHPISRAVVAEVLARPAQ